MFAFYFTRIILKELMLKNHKKRNNGRFLSQIYFTSFSFNAE